MRFTEILSEARGMIGLHGTSSAFYASIVNHGLIPDPEKRIDTGTLLPYRGTYFTDYFPIALHRAGVAAKRFKGKPIVIICNITAKIAGDEDALTEFFELLRDGFFEADPADPKQVGAAFEDHFDKVPPRSLFTLLDHLAHGGKYFDATYRDLTDDIMQHLGPQSLSVADRGTTFRVPDGVGVVHILAVVQCAWRGKNNDPAYTPPGTTYRVIYGKVPRSVDIDNFAEKI